ncbi:hypothetical protein HID58_040745 [Brassica napus]|uniref:Uncharacterized protein n=1 Tax=Brassica napus TaxID=3708 RepID=A0ABQ8B8W6_BRANA|nr:hypothetical protein HID58_040745 [Brassica napus]
MIKKEANTSDLKKENVRLAVHIESLEKQVKNEKTRSSDFNAKLEHHYKTVRMLTGSKELDKILSLGRHDQTSRGLGYTGYGKSDTEPIKFVPSSNSRERTTTEGTTSKTGFRISKRWDDQRFSRRDDVTTVKNRVTSRRNAITFGKNFFLIPPGYAPYHNRLPVRCYNVNHVEGLSATVTIKCNRDRCGAVLSTYEGGYKSRVVTNICEGDRNSVNITAI